LRGLRSQFEAWHRPSINLTLGEEWTADEIREATSARCPECGLKVELATLIMEATQR